MRVLVFMLLALAAAGQSDPARPPDPKTKARELLDAAVETAGGATPEVHAAALMRAGATYDTLDSKRSLAILKQAFAAAAAIPPENDSPFRYATQSETVRLIAPLDINTAVDLLKQMTAPAKGDDSRVPAGTMAVYTLLQKEKVDAAIELIESMSGFGVDLFRAASLVFAKLAPDDPRRMRVWSWAAAANAAKPNRAFTDMLARHWKDLPPETVDLAVRAVVDGVLGRKADVGDGYTMIGLMTSKGIVSLPSQQDAELFEIMHLVRSLDTKRADEILGTRPQLRDALERFPMGTRSMAAREGEGYTSFTTRTDSQGGVGRGTAMQNGIALNHARAAEALAALDTDPDKALSLVPHIPDPAKQAETLGTIARRMAEKDPAKARSALTKCLTMLDTIKRPADRLAPWDAVAEASWKIKDDKLTDLALDRMLADAAALYKADTDSEHLNKGWRDRWPSTMAYRRVARRAAECYGVHAETLLLKITDTDLFLFAKIEMAAALLGRR